jgi:hypothetical protein
VVTFLVTSSFSYARAVDISRDPTPEQQLEMDLHNQSLHDSSFSRFKFEFPKPTVRPFAEYEKNGFVFIDAGYNFDSLPVKQTIARNLPLDVALVVVITPYAPKTAEQIQKDFSPYISKDRLKILKIDLPGVSFWARDEFPIPTVIKASNSLQLVNAKYYHHFEPDTVVAEWFKSPLVSHNYYFEGGNFVANTQGDCIIIDRGKAGALPGDEIFGQYYGCKKMFRLPKLKGIGHIDESVKFISDRVIITDTTEYAVTLKKAGFEVHMLPRSTGYQTYVNSLLINGTIFVPIFGEDSDQEALAVYSSLSLKVIPINSSHLSEGKGSIHCITMNYPPMDLQVLLDSIF